MILVNSTLFVMEQLVFKTNDVCLKFPKSKTEQNLEHQLKAVNWEKIYGQIFHSCILTIAFVKTD